MQTHLATVTSLPGPPAREAGIVSWGPLHVDLLAGFARVHGEVIELQPLQLRILGYLVVNAGKTVTSEELRREVFRTTQAARSTSVARQISALRARLAHARHLLVTVPGGYGIGLSPGLRH